MEFFKKIEIFPRRQGFFPYVFLPFLFLPYSSISMERGNKLIVGYVLLLLFLIAYRQLYFANKSFTFWIVLQLAIIFILSDFYSANNLFMGFFTCNFIGWYKEKQSFIITFLLLILVEVSPMIIHIKEINMNDLMSITPFLLAICLMPFANRSMMKRRELENQLNEANNQIKELVKRDERTRIARDLHDTLGHTLSLITLKSQLVGKLVEKNPEKAKLEAKEIEQTSRSALKQVRELVADMRAISVSEELIEVKTILKSASIAYHFDGASTLIDVVSLKQNILSMCLREAVTNVVKHSKADNCYVTVNQNNHDVTIIVRDDGIGLENKNKNGNGLEGMNERLALVDGEATFSSENGTIVTISVPLIVGGKRREGTV